MWLLLRNGHSAADLLDRLDRILRTTDLVNSQFRCWVTAFATDSLSCFVRQTFVKVLLDDTKVGGGITQRVKIVLKIYFMNCKVFKIDVFV